MFARLLSSFTSVTPARRGLVALSILALAACAPSSDEDVESGEGAATATQPPTAALPGEECTGAGMSNERIVALSREESRASVSGNVSVVKLGTFKATTYGPSRRIFGDWEAYGPMSIVVGSGSQRSTCYECRGGYQDSPVNIEAKLERIGVWLGYDNVDKTITLSLSEADAKYDPDKGAFVRNSYGLSALNCTVTDGDVKCANMVYSGTGGQDPRSFHDLAFEGRLTDRCLRLTAKTSDKMYGAVVQTTQF